MIRQTYFSYEKLFGILQEQQRDDWQFAFDVGTNFNTIDRMLHGKSVPMSVLNRICDELGVGLDDIVERKTLEMSNVSFAQYINAPAMWTDLEDVAIKAIRVKFVTQNELKRLDDLHFLIGNLDDKCADIPAFMMANIEWDTDKNPHAGWIVTDRKLLGISSIERVHTCSCHSHGSAQSSGVMSSGYELVIEVTDPDMLVKPEEDA